jgi:hypothetical protein
LIHLFVPYFEFIVNKYKDKSKNTKTFTILREFYNSNFINVAVDSEKEGGIELARKYQLQKLILQTT